MGFSGWEYFVGAQWMLITTIGRKTGKRREAIVDVMDYDQATDTYFIEAAYGLLADWYKNIQKNPIFEVQVGKRKFKARARVLSNQDAGEMLVQFYRHKPAYTRTVLTMAGIKFKNEDDLHTIGKNLTLLAVKPEKNEN